MAKSKLYLVEASMLPDVFLRVCEAKELLARGTVRTVAEATARAGISRSAYYKYKDSITPFRDVRRDRIVTMSLITQDRPGALSSVLTLFAEAGANILTINQSIPTNGVGVVTISFTAEDLRSGLDELRERLSALPTVVDLSVLAG
ncbi:MAG: ACT domain-containing protein [Oscillospiraceae bacterium]|nr:ACT domain-containing protein [Oscillospiraceae bacterium]MBQ2633826.1 ACT domain-containing protein [Oscillospiraceae bacterium]MBR3084271.1 ACT domain-containing protein [Oscillospiraceae bacterium]MBR3860503.1 ACT domain-containing protein [Oscillospiraceae bacterium]MBR6095975.1 ACT domain-containing protein [Oscillospiraceae bacterium]